MYSFYSINSDDVLQKYAEVFKRRTIQKFKNSKKKCFLTSLDMGDKRPLPIFKIALK